MSANVIALQQAKDMELKIPKSLTVKPLKESQLSNARDIGWYVFAENRDKELLCCMTAQARKLYRTDIDNDIIKLESEAGHSIKEVMVEGAVISWLVHRREKETDSEEEIDDSAAQKIFRNWAWQAYDMGASDVHFFMGVETSSVVFRIHGLPYDFTEDVTYRIKRICEAGLQLSPIRKGTPDRHKIEDLRIELVRGSEKITLRLNKTGSEPETHTVFRIIKVERARTLQELRLPAHVAKSLEHNGNKASGVIIIAAPTNQGKSDSLASIYNGMDNERIIQIVSDPIEKEFPGKEKRLVQKEVNKDDPNRTYDALFNASLRQDSDVTGIAEMRDPEVMQKVYKAALGGRLMATTFHALTPFSALTRLLESGVSTLVIGEKTRCIASQRLLPELCPSCRKPSGQGSAYTRNKKGCSEPKCVYGAVGRRVTAEVLTFDKSYLPFIQQRDVSGLEAHVKENGYITMQEDVKQLVVEGNVCPFDAETIVGDVYTEADLEQFLKRGAVA